jgi:hypothetical protein
MKNIILVFLLFSAFYVFSEEGFYLQNRSGILIKVDVESGLKQNNPKKAGPGFKDVPLQSPVKDFEKDFLSTVTKETDRLFILEAYQKDENNYILKTDFIPEKLYISIIKQNILKNINVPEKNLIQKFYKPDVSKEFYILKKELNEDEKIIISTKLVPLFVRVIFLQYNKDNEIETGIDFSGSPSPHKFPRVWNPKSKAAIDIHFVWGWKDIANSGVTLGFSVNLTNFIMPSLEIMVKYNFKLNDYKFVEPYVGGALYGGFMDGFPIGISALGGTDIYPTYQVDGKTNFFISGEGRLGGVLYSKTYFDTGENTEGIWKKLSGLAEGGFYFNTGYRFDKK